MSRNCIGKGARREDRWTSERPLRQSRSLADAADEGRPCAGSLRSVRSRSSSLAPKVRTGTASAESLRAGRMARCRTEDLKPAESQPVTVAVHDGDATNATLFLRFATSLVKRRGKESTWTMQAMAGAPAHVPNRVRQGPAAPRTPVARWREVRTDFSLTPLVRSF